MKFFLKSISLTYLVILSIALLIPLNLFVVTNIIPLEKQPDNNTSFIIHLSLFFILYTLFYFSFSNKNKIFFFCMIYSFGIELLQIFTSRGFQIFDIVFNFLGILIPYFLFFYFFKFKFN
jgi:glycopeptide antibiotics resistance protein